ncbi:hypothetical protein F4811DRAFT_525873 [Daldinia bambusicola]|nr:hypothetical protein F4811DRAFT_525873 [Daldinia bambusicola]
MPPPNNYSDYRAWLDAQQEKNKNEVIMKLKEHGLLSDEQMDAFKCDVVMSSKDLDGEQQRRPSRISRSRQLELNKEFDSLSLYSFTSAMWKYFHRNVPIDRCIRTFEDLVSVLSKNDQGEPPKTKVNPNEKPATPFSVSRAAPGFVMSNGELIEALAVSVDMEPQCAIMIRGQITWHDSYDGSSSGSLELSTGLVGSGRLGRKHMLADVPNNFVRDRLMDYIITQLEDHQQESAKKAVFPDLSASELEQYTALIMKKIEASKPKTQDEMISQIVGNKPIKTNDEMRSVLSQAYAIDQVNQDVNCTPQPGFGIRSYARPGPIIRSVVQPGLKELTLGESRLDVGTDIDMDCDQIRAIIVRFTNGSGWTADQFRLALSGVSRAHLTVFLHKRGPRKGADSPVYQLAWEFFKKREALSLPLTNVSEDVSKDTAVLQERDANRSNKRQSVDGEGSGSWRKRTRRAQ